MMERRSWAVVKIVLYGDGILMASPHQPQWLVVSGVQPPHPLEEAEAEAEAGQGAAAAVGGIDLALPNLLRSFNQ
jgi:hypothetical protein